ncbi:hypothetical protein Nepgr_011758 [Nepenthes gracilis]|uniref:Uncharacterized protein n=1 Tax=Nepenthes gracilis TaxID=150966 RepID=A0AAD3SG28_NEPGR|nr:hypothetical protein Nepgr_011758 [Nepenthes gracilis]
MNPLSSINKIFALISQEERQREITTFGASNMDSIAMYSKINTGRVPTNTSKWNYRYGRKERPTCSYCGFLGHAVDMYYKLHGYPPGFKTKTKGYMQQSLANQVAKSEIADDNS